jgi:hypothetical protein
MPVCMRNHADRYFFGYNLKYEIIFHIPIRYIE